MSTALHPLQIQAREVRARFFPAVATRIVRRQWPTPTVAPPKPVVIPDQPVPCLLDIPRDTCPWAAPREDGTYPVWYLLAISAFVGETTVADLKSIRRDNPTVRPRHVFCWVARRFGPLHLRSLPEIGRHLGGRDHTTSLHAVRRVERVARSIDAPADDTPRAWAVALLSSKWPDNQRGPKIGSVRKIAP